MKQTKRILISVLFILLYNITLNAQINISGTIKDCEESLVGVTILLEGTNISSLSDFNGNYEISAPDTNAILVYRYFGYTTQKIKVGTQTIINVILKGEPETLSPSKDNKYNKTDLTGKPVIYLYPKSETDVNIKLQYNGKILITYPEYKNGWNVRAFPNGTLKNKENNRVFSYLFWDGEKTYSETELKYSTGFIVEKDSAVSFLQNILPKLGLEPHEYNEFIVFWLPFLRKSDWNFVYFRTGKEYDVISTNIVNPKPETEIRVFMEFKEVDKSFFVEPQIFSTPIRKGFTLVEWGGTQLKHSISVKDEKGTYITK